MSAKVNDVNTKLAADLKALISFSEQGVGTAAPDFFEGTLGDDTCTKAELDRVQKHCSNFAVAVGTAFGEASIEFLAKNKDVDSTSFACRAGQDKVEVVFLREKTYAPGPAGGEPIVKQGVLVTKWVAQAGANKGQLKAAKGVLGEKAAAAFKK